MASGVVATDVSIVSCKTISYLSTAVTEILSAQLLGSITVLCMQMWTIVTGGVAWSVSRSVCHSSEPGKTDEPIEMPFGLRTWVSPRNHVLDGVQIAYRKRQFRGGKVKYRDQGCRVGVWILAQGRSRSLNFLKSRSWIPAKKGLRIGRTCCSVIICDYFFLNLENLSDCILHSVHCHNHTSSWVSVRL